jgi:hypothetical protein
MSGLAFARMFPQKHPTWFPRNKAPHSFRPAHSGGLKVWDRKRLAHMPQCRIYARPSPRAASPFRERETADRAAVAVRSRALLAQAASGFDDEIDLAFLENIDRLSASQPIIRVCKEVQDIPPPT